MQKRKKYDKFWAQGSVWDCYGDSSSMIGHFSRGKCRRGSQGRSESQLREWPPWLSTPAAERPARPVTSYEVTPANRGENPWTSWTKEVRARMPDSQDEAQSSSWKADAGGATAFQQSWSSSGSGWSRPSTWAAPATSSLSGPDHATDHEWYQL